MCLMNKNTDQRAGPHSRREFLSTALAAPILTIELSGELSAAFQPDSISVASPDGRVRFDILLRERSRLSYRVTFRKKMVIDASALGIVIDGVDLCQGAEAGKVERYRLNERYAWRGVHSEAVNNCNGAKLSLKHAKSGTGFTLDVRAFNDGVAFRFVASGAEKPRVPDETTAFTLPARSTVWYHDFEGHYEGMHARKEIADTKAGEWAAPPLTIKLPDGSGYAAITEAALVHYAGMGLQADGQRGFNLRLGHAHPASYPFRLRYAADVERLKQPAAIAGTIVTPWRVVMIGADLNALVNCDIVNNVSPPLNDKLFPKGIKTDWLKPGRAVWKYLDGGENTLEEVKNFSRMAGELGFEYQVVEGFWSRWSEEQIRDAVEFSRQHKVRLLFWKHSRDLRTPEARKQFFDLCQRVGVAGAKIDFFDHEAKEIIDLYQVLLSEAAERKLIVDFHGANKPAGEARTWPNEMTREGIYGMEHRRTEAWAPVNTTLPFTRLLAGHADYTPMLFGERRKETSWAHQIASAAIFTSPLLVYGAHPKNILANPAVEIIKSIPSVWDETIALPACEVGELAAFARRNRSTWFLAVMNGSTARTVKIRLAFLGGDNYQATLAQDRKDEAAALTIENTILSRNSSLTIELRAGGGFIGRFIQQNAT
jgi:alpha-glucosidase